MANQQTGGNGSKMRVPTADRARNIPQNVEDLYNLELVNLAFEDGSIDPTKILGGLPAGGAFAYVAGTLGLYGTQNTATAFTQSIQIGIGADGDGNETISIGSDSYAGGQDTMAIGHNAYTFNDDYGLSIGSSAWQRGVASVAIGRLAHVHGDNAIAIGGGYVNNSAGSVAIGLASIVAGGSNSISILGNVKVTGDVGSVSIGNNSYTTADNTVALGNGAVGGTTGATIASVSIGSNATCYNGGVSIGVGSIAESLATAIGASTEAKGTNSLGIGTNAGVTAAGVSSVAMGHNVSNSIANSVKFGVSSSNHITFDNWTTAVGAAVASTHTLEMKIGAATYKILLSNV